ncbi:PREDICTED: basic salivary proline-rich protein 3-like [Condylura cristata]|uniref:basic salivary proline-rich protein 3-like n=1 Tax=Condylura cristata TaxID=143302 RepID=UPI0006436D2B|nr:PREDICTED: basic salivary proline-rich protein 3-like [Condylura cristata]
MGIQAHQTSNADDGLTPEEPDATNTVILLQYANGTRQTGPRSLALSLCITSRDAPHGSSSMNPVFLQNRDAGTDTGYALPRPPSPRTASPEPVRRRRPQPHLGPRAGRPRRRPPRPCPPQGPGEEPPGCGARGVRPRLGTRGGGGLQGVPPTPGPSVRWPPPRTHRQKDRQPATVRGARSRSILSQAREGRNPGSFYPEPRRSAALRAPGPRLRTDGPRDNGPRAAARAGRAGALRHWAPAGGGRLRAKPVTGSRGAALQTDKANGRQTDGGGKDGDAGGGSAQLAHPQREGRVHEPLLSPSPSSLAWSPSPLPGCAPGGMGGAYGGRGVLGGRT